MKNIIKFMLFTAIIATISCSQPMDENWYSEGDYFYLKNKDAVMPVWVTGNIASGVFIVTNHGGPSYDSGILYHESEHFFQRLEKDYALVYWDQRMSGSAKGDPKHEDLSVALHVEDLEKLMALLRSKYTMNSTFIYGHSWGGGLCISYLGKDNNQAQINGWIDEDGSLQDKLEMDLKREWILPRAEKKLAETGDSYWQEVIDWWANNPNPTEADLEPYEHVRNLNGYIYDAEKVNELNNSSVFERTFLSPKSFMWVSNQYSNTDWLANYDFMPQAKNITIPTLLVWGKEDGAVPAAVSDTLYKIIKTPAEDKYLYQFDECGHSPHWENPHEYYEIMVDFVEKYR